MALGKASCPRPYILFRIMKKAIAAFSIVALSLLNGLAQTITISGQDAYVTLFNQSVKSCEEFMCRFNEEEFFPGLDKNDPELGKKNFLSLFDYQLAAHKDKNKFLSDVFSFYDAVRRDSVRLCYESKNWYAELRTMFKFQKKEVELGIILQPERTPRNLQCWTIVGVNGLDKVGYVDSTSRQVISPEQHEAEFMEIESCFKFSSRQFSQFRGYQTSLDALSYFFALVESGALVFDSRVSTKFHFFDVPSYMFTVSYHGRETSNTGWLISDCKEVTEKEKAKILKELLSK